MTLFYELIQVALGEKENLSSHPSEKEWELLFSASLKQTVAGLTFCALDKLSKKGQNIPISLLYEWIGASENIRQQNLLLNRRSVEITSLLLEEGFRSCILKGQGNALMYADPYLRAPGDIDIWLDGEKEKIVNFVRKKFPNTPDNGIHLDYPIYADVDVEVHYQPQYLASKHYNKRLVDFFTKESDAQFSHKVQLPGVDGEVSVPYAYFNLILQLAHILGHFYGEGLGFRHLVDIYYVLKNIGDDHRNYENLLSHLGLLSFAKGIMWIEHDILGLDESYLVVKPSEKKGRLILREIEEGGNFGYYNKKNIIRNKSVFVRAFMDTYRHLQLFTIQPSEAFQRLINKMTNVKSWKEAIQLK